MIEPGHRLEAYASLLSGVSSDVSKGVLPAPTAPTRRRKDNIGFQPLFCSPQASALQLAENSGATLKDKLALMGRSPTTFSESYPFCTFGRARSSSKATPSFDLNVPNA